MDHLQKKDVEYWLWEKENLNKEIVEYFWANLWGSVWEIWQCLLDYKNTWDYKVWVENLIIDEYAKIFDLYTYELKENERELFVKVNKKIVTKSEYNLELWENIMDMIKKLVDIDIWFYESRKQRITANSRTTKKCFEKLVKEMEK